MSLFVCCPQTSYLVSAVTTLNPCPADVGQIQKLVFWRTSNTLTVASSVTATSWNLILSAVGATKALVSPFVHNPDIPSGDPREYGGGNETRWGAPLRKGSQSPTLTFTMLAEDQDVITALKYLRCEALDVIFINEANQFIYSDTQSGTAGFWGFEVVPGSLFISDKKIGGFEEWDANLIQFNLKPNWSDTLEISTETTFALSMVNV